MIEVARYISAVLVVVESLMVELALILNARYSTRHLAPVDLVRNVSRVIFNYAGQEPLSLWAVLRFCFLLFK